jgi:hypothetical protein
MVAEPIYPDVPMPTSIIIEPILPLHREILTELMKGHGGRLEGNEVFFPQGTLKQFLWPRISNWRFVILFPDGYKIGLTETRDRKNVLSLSSHDFICPTCKRPV